MVIAAPHDAGQEPLTRGEKGAVGKEDRCPDCVLVNGIYWLDPNQELVFPLSLSQPVGVQLRLCVLGADPTRVTAGLYREDRADAAWTPSAALVGPGTAIIDGYHGLRQVQAAGGNRWLFKLRNPTAHRVLAALFVIKLGLTE